MNKLAELFVTFLGLLEEEGRVLRERTASLFLSIVLLAVAGLLLAAGLFSAAAGVFYLLLPLLGRVGSWFALCAFFLALSYFILRRAAVTNGNGNGERNSNGNDAASAPPEATSGEAES